MADPQDRPEGEPQSGPPAKKALAKKAAAAKAQAKKAPAKKAATGGGPAKVPAKKAPAKKAPAKKVPAKEAQPAPKLVEQPAEAPADLQQRAETNGQLAAAKDAAAQAKSTVEKAENALPLEPSESSPLQSPGPWLVAITLSLLAMLLVRQLRRR
ncbi:Rv3852 family protein [Mycobacterium sp. Z3061]|uniref:Rv3852 family protein n=1 Tax=Mycobacterium sp. Z3061 TaxID=3073562 RepID=UPI002873370D|nr:nucleoid-structuring protein H-NS [Mycobacterium sp. Z3061]